MKQPTSEIIIEPTGGTTKIRPYDKAFYAQRRTTDETGIHGFGVYGPTAEIAKERLYAEIARRTAADEYDPTLTGFVKSVTIREAATVVLIAAMTVITWSVK